MIYINNADALPSPIQHERKLMCLIGSHAAPHIYQLYHISIAVIVECLDSNVTMIVRAGETKARESLTHIKVKFGKTTLDMEANRKTIKYAL